jgi:hypothetical protein
MSDQTERVGVDTIDVDGRERRVETIRGGTIKGFGEVGAATGADGCGSGRLRVAKAGGGVAVTPVCRDKVPGVVQLGNLSLWIATR